MSEMIERIAKAIMSAENPDSRDQYAEMARAAFVAMKNPTHEMIGAALDDYDRRGGRQGYTDAWNAMIDAALKNL